MENEAQRALSLSGNVSESGQLFIQAGFHMMHGNYSQAAPILEALLRIRPDHYFAYRNLVNAYQRTGRERDAAEVMAGSADMRPNNYLANAGAASVLMRISLQRASICARQALTLAGKQPKWMKGISRPVDIDVLMFRFHELWMQDDVRSALKELERLTRLPGLPNRPGFAATVAQCYLVLGRF